jgi:hypothetical protein
VKQRIKIEASSHNKSVISKGSIPMLTDGIELIETEEDLEMDRKKRSKKAGAISPSLGSTG